MQEKVWENEYRNQKLITLSQEPIKSLKDFVRFLRKEQELQLSNLNILDLGCGNAKNSFYISEQGINNKITGIDISDTVLNNAKEMAPDGYFIKQNMGEILPFSDSHFDIILDITSSNSLTESERSTYLKEINRVLKGSGYIFIRALCKDGDQNAKNLLKTSPAKEKDTYIMPGIGLTERVFSKDDLISTYSNLFEIIYLEKETHYTKINNRSYKRNFWVVYLKKT